MTWIELIALLMTALIVPFFVQLIKVEAITGNAARWLAIAVSIVAGIAAALVSGIPETPDAWLVCILAAIGAVQIAYSAFKSVGITCKALDALAEIDFKNQG